MTIDQPPRNPWDEPPAIQRPLGSQVFPWAMVTGHRPQHLTPAEIAWSQVALHRAAWRLRSVYGTTNMVSGLALGADTWWAMAALACGAHLHSYIPFEEQAKPWPEPDRAIWAELRLRSKTVTVVGGQTYDVKMLHARNDAMLAATAAGNGAVVALYKPGTSGGTASAVAKTRRRSQPLLILNPAERTMRWDESTDLGQARATAQPIAKSA